MAQFHRGIEVVERYWKGREIVSAFHKGKLYFEKIMGFIFTRDGFSLRTKDGFTVKCKDQ